MKSELEDFEHLIDTIADAIDDSMDYDWRSRDGAKIAAQRLVARHAIKYEKES